MGQTATSRGAEITKPCPNAHLDLFLQVFSSSHEILNLPWEDIRVGGKTYERDPPHSCCSLELSAPEQLH